MRALIVDDHKINFVLIKNLLEESFPEISSINKADSVGSALTLLELTSYDIIFLDMQLKDGIGFDILKEIIDFVFVIVISSHKDYALEAFKYNVVDYLIKPINTNEFNHAVRKVLDLHKGALTLKKDVPENQSQLLSKNNERLFVIHKNEHKAIIKKDILYIKAQGKYSEIHTVHGDKYISSKNLKEFEDTVSDALIRIHHSYLVNTRWVISYSREESQLKLESGINIPVSIRKREELFKHFGVF